MPLDTTGYDSKHHQIETLLHATDHYWLSWSALRLINTIVILILTDTYWHCHLQLTTDNNLMLRALVRHYSPQ